MPSESGYYRHPTLTGNHVAFVCEDDLWTVSAEGGIARRLTASPGLISFPSYSPDGRQIAFSSRDDGPIEIYVMDSEGGSSRRLSWFGSMTHPVGWSRDGKRVLAATNWRQPFISIFHLHSLPVAGGPPRAIACGPARAASYRPEGPGIVIGRNSGDPARWKRYRGGTAGSLWIDRKGDGSHTPLIKLAGNLGNPMWIGSRIYFLSDHEGCGNLYSCTTTGRGIKRHTDHEDFYVRFPSTDGRRIVYHAGADLYLFDPVEDSSRNIDIRIHSTQSQVNRKFVDASKYLESFNLHPKGHSLATVTRGGLFTMPLWEGASRRYGEISSVRYRLGTWLPDGERIVGVCDEGGEEQLVVFSVDGKTNPEKIKGDFGRPILLQAAPGDILEPKADPSKPAKPRKPKTKPKIAPDLVALTNQRHELILVNLTTGRSKVLDRSNYGRMEGVTWSPDSKWIAYAYPTSARNICIKVCAISSGATWQVTRPDFRDVSPSFDPSGKYLYFISWRTYDPVCDSLCFDRGFPRGARPYLITLKSDTVSPFAAATREPKPPATGPGPGVPSTGKDPKQVKKGKFAIDFEGIEDRVLAFPVPDGRYEQVLGAHGRVLFTSLPIEGSLGVNWWDRTPPAKEILEAYEFEKCKVIRISDKVSAFSLSLDKNVLGIRSGNRIRLIPTDTSSETKPVPDKPGRETGWLDLSRIRQAVIPTEEWHQMFREAWRMQRDQFWTEDMSGLDWGEVYQRYLPLVARAGSRAEFSDLMWEMQGELGTSHCYEMGGDYLPQPAWYQGFLGADIEFNRRQGAWVIRRIPQGDSWDPNYTSPLTAPGINVQVGDEIVAIGGQLLDRHNTPYEQLVHQAGCPVEITIRAGAKNTSMKPGETRNTTVTTLRGEPNLRYRDWVEGNRRRVHRESKGTVGYIHIPDMGPIGYSEFHRYFGTEVEHDGLIIDVRFNGGGNVSQLLLEKLLRRRIGYDVNRWGQPESYPDAAPVGPMVALTNEYAGSDGDMFSHAFKLNGLGKLIGKRTWGGVIGIWPRAALVDGSVTTQPEFAFWFEDVGFGIENYGTDPDIEVEIRPQDYAAGRDTQLERGLSEIGKLLRKKPPTRPDFSKRPVLVSSSLPKPR